MVFAQNEKRAFTFCRDVLHKVNLTEEQKKRYQYIHEHNFVIKSNASTNKPELIVSDAK